MSLPDLDVTYLNERDIAHEIILESGMILRWTPLLRQHEG